MGNKIDWTECRWRGCGRERASAGLLVYSALSVVTIVAFASGHPAVSAAIAIAVAVVEVSIKVRRQRRERTERLVASLIGNQLSDVGLQQVLSCWSRRRQ